MVLRDMEKDGDPNSPTPPTPEVDAERLLKALEIQMAAKRARPEAVSSDYNLVSFRYWSLIVIVVGTLVSVAIMEYFVSQLPRPRHAQPAPSATPGRP